MSWPQLKAYCCPGNFCAEVKASLSEIQARPGKFARALAAELLGTMLLVIIGCGATIGGDAEGDISDQAKVVRIALAFGLAVAALVACFGHVSGAHINPAVTCGVASVTKMGCPQVVGYLFAQCLGGALGGWLLAGLTPESFRGEESLGTTSPAAAVTDLQAFVVELLITYLLVTVVLAVAVDKNNKSNQSSAALAIGLTVTACHLWAVPLTGAGMNPARSLGASTGAKLTDSWSRFWVYSVAPILGGALAGFLYAFVFAAPEAAASSASQQADAIIDVEEDFTSAGAALEEVASDAGTGVRKAAA